MVLIAMAAGVFLFLSAQKRESDIARDETLGEEYSGFIASLKNSKEKKMYPPAASKQRPEKEYVLFAFNPNTADSITFLELGLPPWMAKNILSYRRKGGRFRNAGEFRKIYGLSDEKYTELSAYIQIPKELPVRRDSINLFIPTVRKDSLATLKYAQGTVINLNKADTTELKKIPGIGSGIARMIVGYRGKLGGFFRVGQLQEIGLDTIQLAPWLTVGASETMRIDLNKASADRLRKHPYFNFYQAKAIVEHRKKKGALKGLHQLSLYDEFSDNDFERMKHYVCFE